MINIFIGYDSREHLAFEVCRHSIMLHATKPVNIIPLKLDELERKGLMTRTFYKTSEGKYFDFISQAHASTEFAISRFLSLILLQEGVGIFLDCDILLTGDITQVLDEYDPAMAVQCVQHDYKPKNNTKMDGQEQSCYKRKNWSSFFVFNAEHEANKSLTLFDVNRLPGRELHAFCWLSDDLIGSLTPRWNWLIGEQEKPEAAIVYHYTNGGPWLKGWKGSEHDDTWFKYYKDYRGFEEWLSRKNSTTLQ